MTFKQLNATEATGSTATIKTNMGDMTFKLFDESTPKTVKNFIELAKKGYYDGIIFHRVISDFMIQGGDPSGTGMGGESIYGSSFEDEFVDDLFNLRGALSMANAGPNTNGSQFFIVQNQNVPANMIGQLEGAGYPTEIVEAYKNGGTPWLDHRHTVFGQIVSGTDVMDKISAVKKGPQDRPVNDIVIETIEISD